MAISRKLPKTDVTRNIAMKIAKIALGITAPADVPMKAATVSTLNVLQPEFANLMDLRAFALQAQSTATLLKAVKQARTAMYISHFIQGFNNAVLRGVFPAADRAFYKLDVSSNSVPSLGKEADVVIWGENLITGETARIAAGGAPMSNPPIEEVQDEYNAFVAANADQILKKKAYDDSQEAVGAKRNEVDKLILRIWDEVEAEYNDGTIESKRRKAREWGVYYASTIKATITGLVTDSATSAPLKDVSVTLIESGDTVLTDAEGKYKLTTGHFGTGTLEFALIEYVTQNITIELTEGGTLAQDAILTKI